MIIYNSHMQTGFTTQIDQVNDDCRMARTCRSSVIPFCEEKGVYCYGKLTRSGQHSQHCIHTATPSASMLLSLPFLLLKWVLDHPHLFLDVVKLCLPKGLGEDVRHLFSCGSVAQLYSSSLDTVPDKVTSDINML